MLAVQEETERALGSHRLRTVKVIVIKRNITSSVNKYNHPLQNILLLVTEPWTHGSIK
jgi:hypothetical protein